MLRPISCIFSTATTNPAVITEKNYELLAATEVIHSIEEAWRHSSSSFTAKLVKVLTILDDEPAAVVQIYALLMREAYLYLKKTFTVAPTYTPSKLGPRVCRQTATVVYKFDNAGISPPQIVGDCSQSPYNSLHPTASPWKRV